MAITIKTSGKNLCAGLQKVLKLKPNKVLPILECIHALKAGNTLTLTSNNLETCISTQVTVNEDGGDGEFLLPLRAYSMLQLLKEIEAITIIADDIEVVILYGNGNRLKCLGERAENFPGEKPTKILSSFTQDHKAFGKLLHTAKKFVSTDDLRPAMTGVLMTGKNIVATDAHRLIEMEFNPGVADLKCIIPVDFINAFSIFESTVMVDITEERIQAIDRKGTSLSCRWIDARYPDYQVVIPTENPLHIELNKKEFLNNLRLALGIADASNRQIAISFFHEGRYELSAQNMELFDEIILHGNCTFTVNDRDIAKFKISFNALFLQQVLDVNGAELVTFEMDKPTKCMIMHAEGLQMLLMPLQLLNEEEVETIRKEAVEKLKQSDKAMQEDAQDVGATVVPFKKKVIIASVERIN